MCFGNNFYIYHQLKMPVTMAGQTFFRTCALISNNTKLTFSHSRISQVNIKTPSMGLKTDAKSFIDSHKIPEKPKRPLTAYIRFLLEKRHSVLKENPALQSQDVMKVISSQWKVLSAEDKCKYEDIALQDKENYNTEVLKYNAQLTPEQEEIIHQIAAKKRQDKKKRKIKKEFKAMGRPKRPLTSFGLFVQENAIHGKSLVELMPQLQEKWAQMPATEKQKYQTSFQKNKEEYETILAKWETDMITQGKQHLVRVKTLRKKGGLTRKKSKKGKSE